MDIDGIEPGVDFVKALDEQVAQASAFIAVIGPGWTELKNAEGQRRLDQPNDHVRIEIESALKRDIRVIPVLVDGARMPTENELPDSLKPLSRRNAACLVTIASAPRWMIWLAASKEHPAPTSMVLILWQTPPEKVRCSSDSAQL